MFAVDVLLILVGFALLTFAADRLVVAAARISAKFGLSSVLIGAVVVGLGTSLPEMLVSGFAAARPGGLDFAMGNIVGSNVANLALVLGVSAIISPIARQPDLLRQEGPVMFLGSVLLTVVAFDDSLGRLEGTVLAIGLVVALGVIIHWSRGDSGLTEEVVSDIEEIVETEVDAGREVAFALGSLVLTLLGAEALVRGARAVALELGVSEAVISLTLVAIGTSLPELATAVAAARRNENDLVLGNVLGSNIFNALGVGAVAALVGAGSLSESFRGPLLVMLAVTALTGLLARFTPRLGRREGIALLVTYPLVLVFL